MEVKFADSFFKSFRTMIRNGRWYVKVFDFFRYNVPYFLKNFWRFRRELWEFRNWDSSYSLRMFMRGIELNTKCLENGLEVAESRMKKVAAMRRAVELLRHYCDDEYIRLAEKHLGLEMNCNFSFVDTPDGMELKDTCTDEEHRINATICAFVRYLESSEWDELWTIIKGTNTMDEHDGANYNGNDIRGWWD